MANSSQGGNTFLTFQIIKVNVREILISFAWAAANSFSKLSIFSLSKGSNSLPCAHVEGSSQTKYPQVSSTLQQEEVKKVINN